MTTKACCSPAFSSGQLGDETVQARAAFPKSLQQGAPLLANMLACSLTKLALAPLITRWSGAAVKCFGRPQARRAPGDETLHAFPAVFYLAPTPFFHWTRTRFRTVRDRARRSLMRRSRSSEKPFLFGLLFFFFRIFLPLMENSGREERRNDGCYLLSFSPPCRRAVC